MADVFSKRKRDTDFTDWHGLNPKTGIDLEQEQTESTERRIGPGKLWNGWFGNALSATASLSVPSVPSCEMTLEFRFNLWKFM
jgi:hypothetical protein